MYSIYSQDFERVNFGRLHTRLNHSGLILAASKTFSCFNRAWFLHTHTDMVAPIALLKCLHSTKFRVVELIKELHSKPRLSFYILATKNLPQSLFHELFYSPRVKPDSTFGHFPAQISYIIRNSKSSEQTFAINRTHGRIFHFFF